MLVPTELVFSSIATGRRSNSNGEVKQKSLLPQQQKLKTLRRKFKLSKVCTFSGFHTRISNFDCYQVLEPSYLWLLQEQGRDIHKLERKMKKATELAEEMRGHVDADGPALNQLEDALTDCGSSLRIRENYVLHEVPESEDRNV